MGHAFKEGLLLRAVRSENVSSMPLLHPMSMNCGLYRTALVRQSVRVIAPYVIPDGADLKPKCTLPLCRLVALNARLAEYHNITSPAEQKLRLGHRMEDFLFNLPQKSKYGRSIAYVMKSPFCRPFSGHRGSSHVPHTIASLSFFAQVVALVCCRQALRWWHIAESHSLGQAVNMRILTFELVLSISKGLSDM